MSPNEKGHIKEGGRKERMVSKER